MTRQTDTRTSTDTLAAMILRAKARGTGGTFSESGRVHRAGRIDGLCDAWEHLTGKTATVEELRIAADRAR